MDELTKRPPAAREAIIQAAMELIRVKGVVGTSISDVIAQSGTSAGAIYHQFGSKERLVLEVGRTALVAPMAMMLQASVTLSPIDLLSAALVQVAGDERTPELLLQIWAGAKSDPDLYQLLQSEVAQVRLQILDSIERWCVQYAPEADPNSLLEIIIGLVTGYAVQRALTLVANPATYAELCAQVLSTVITSGSPLRA